MDQTLDAINIYQKRKQVEEQLKELLDQFSSDDLIDLIMHIVEKQTITER